jgi:hypothetical protein
VVIEPHHKLVKVAELEDNRDAQSSVRLDAVEEQPINQGATRL